MANDGQFVVDVVNEYLRRFAEKTEKDLKEGADEFKASGRLRDSISYVLDEGTLTGIAEYSLKFNRYGRYRDLKKFTPSYYNAMVSKIAQWLIDKGIKLRKVNKKKLYNRSETLEVAYRIANAKRRGRTRRKVYRWYYSQTWSNIGELRKEILSNLTPEMIKTLNRLAGKNGVLTGKIKL